MNKLARDKILKPKLAKNQNIVIIGLGGVGSIVARYGSVFLASLQKNANLILIDGDKFEPGNSTRMIFGRYGNKAQVIRRELVGRLKDSKLIIDRANCYLTPKNIEGWIRPRDIVLLCVDNHATRKLVDDYCAKLKNICLISGGNDGVEKNSSGKVRRGTYGNVQVHVRRHGKKLTYALQDFHPEIAKPADKNPADLNCTELVASKPQILFANLAVASAMLNTLLLVLSGALHYSELSFDIADGLMRPTIGLKK